MARKNYLLNYIPLIVEGCSISPEVDRQKSRKTKAETEIPELRAIKLKVLVTKREKGGGIIE